MSRVATSKGKQVLPETLNRVVSKRERIVVRREGKKVAALVPIEDLALLEQLEDSKDIQTVGIPLTESHT